MYETNSLVVLGNGFDLNIGLKSGYKDFFESIGICEGKCEDRYFANDIKKLKNMIYQVKDKKLKVMEDPFSTGASTILGYAKSDLKEYILTPSTDNNNYWISYFSYMSELNDPLWNEINDWKDIEERINKLLTEDKNYYLLNEFFDENINKYLDKIIDNIDSLDIESIILIRLIINNNSKSMSKSKFYDVLLYQLKEFENTFKSYLNKVLNSDIGLNEYENRANILILDLINHNEAKNVKSINYNLINFNYTTFYSINDTTKFNVHSNIDDGHPIFGIDSKTLNKKTNENNNEMVPYFKFTKTFRIMDLASKSNLKRILTNEINKIIFYGHSLSTADYSYFLSIFDYYSLYDSRITLIFKYNAHNKNKDKESEDQDALKEKEKTEISVFKLINKYGSEIKHGDNLLHKLLLENRLIFERTINYNSRFN
ncbi:AbiH family protein [Lactobacillaceae bacterium Melli_B4]